MAKQFAPDAIQIQARTNKTLKTKRKEIHTDAVLNVKKFQPM